MNARDELARIIHDAEYGVTRDPREAWPPRIYEAADMILAAGYRKPRTITTTEELDALPDGTVLKSRFGELLELDEGSWRFGDVGGTSDPALPATVLHTPDVSA